jgi:hypothetical protein
VLVAFLTDGAFFVLWNYREKQIDRVLGLRLLSKIEATEQ